MICRRVWRLWTRAELCGQCVLLSDFSGDAHIAGVVCERSLGSSERCHFVGAESLRASDFMSGVIDRYCVKAPVIGAIRLDDVALTSSRILLLGYRA